MADSQQATALAGDLAAEDAAAEATAAVVPSSAAGANFPPGAEAVAEQLSGLTLSTLDPMLATGVTEPSAAAEAPTAASVSSGLFVSVSAQPDVPYDAATSSLTPSAGSAPRWGETRSPETSSAGPQCPPQCPVPERVANRRIAGLEGPLQALRELVGWPSLYGWEGRQLGVRWPRGLLLHGPPGCGKTLLVSAVAEEFDAVVHTITAAEVFGAYVGESERRLREVFEAASADADSGRTAIVFLDEADALCPSRDGRRQHEARVVAQLLTLLDGADVSSRGAGARPGVRGAQEQGHLVVVAATNRPNALDAALRRPGRLDREVLVPVPDAAGREAMLRLHTSGLTLSPHLDLAELAASCHGYSGADLAALAREAAMHALSGVAKQLLAQPWQHTANSREGAAGGDSSMDSVAAVAAGDYGPKDPGLAVAGFTGLDGPGVGVVALEDFQAAMRRVGPSIVRGAEVEVEPIGWDDVGGLPEVKRRLRQAVEWPLLHRDAFARLGLTPPRGVLLFGPPGCSKTTLARAAAASSRATLLPLSCAQLYSMYAGEGEAQLRDTFTRARLAAPSIVFLDEVDALAAKRSESETTHSSSLRLLSALLTEMDGMELATGVLVLAATNRPSAIDAALMRPGRLEVQLYVPPPDGPGRLEVLKVHTSRMPLASDVDLAQLADDTDSFSGAELAGLCREAAMAALREDLQGAAHVAARHFRAARLSKRPSLTPDVLRQYESLPAVARQYRRQQAGQQDPGLKAAGMGLGTGAGLQAGESASLSSGATEARSGGATAVSAPSLIPFTFA